jgi:uncharacterized protein YcaQ
VSDTPQIRTTADLRRLAVTQSLFPPTTLKRALEKFGFVQADPIRAPARAQDLILRHRVTGYRAGDLERLYTRLDIEEDFFINYGFVTQPVQALMHPRSSHCAPRRKRAQLLLEFVRERGTVHPREVNNHFSHGKATNYWGGSSNATTHLMGDMHYQGWLRVVRRDAGIRVYAAHQHPPGPDDENTCRERIDALVDLAVRIYAPLPARSLEMVVRRLRYAVPQWQGKLTKALHRARARLSHARVDGVDWYWPLEASQHESPEAVRLLTPFDPVVWDRARFELLWGWTYRFEAYTPLAKRKLGYYAMPLLWRDRIIGWANLSVKNEELTSDIGYVGSPPRDRQFQRELAEELERMRVFLGLTSRA